MSVVNCPSCGAEHNCIRKGKESLVVRDSDTETHIEQRDAEFNECASVEAPKSHICRMCGQTW